MIRTLVYLRDKKVFDDSIYRVGVEAIERLQTAQGIDVMATEQFHGSVAEWSRHSSPWAKLIHQCERR